MHEKQMEFDNQSPPKKKRKKEKVNKNKQSEMNVDVNNNTSNTKNNTNNSNDNKKDKESIESMSKLINNFVQNGRIREIETNSYFWEYNNTSRNYCAMFASKRLCTNACNLASISVNIDPVTNLTCSRDSPMVDEYNRIIFGLIG